MGILIGYFCAHPISPVITLDSQKEYWGFLGGLGVSKWRGTSLYPGTGCRT